MPTKDGSRVFAESLPRDAFLFAMEHHGNQRYGDAPYIVHLFDVYSVLLEYGYDDNKLLVAALLHDIIEDTSVNYHAVRDRFGEEVAEIVYACTDRLGRSRKDRKAQTLPALIEWTKENGPAALTVKLADWLANVRDSVRNEPSMLQMYQKDWDSFVVMAPLFPALESMWIELASLVERELPRTPSGR